MYFAIVLSLLLVFGAPSGATAQNADDSDPEGLQDLPIPGWGKDIIDSFSRPLHPIIGGVASGGGLGVGVGYDSPDDELLYTDAEAIVTARRYWSLEGEVGRRTRSHRTQIGVFGGFRHMNRLDFFGIGPDTDFDDRTSFRLREATVGTRGWFRATPHVRVGGAAGIYVPDTGRGANPSVPSFEQVFSRDVVPGLMAQPTFSRYRGFIEFLHPRLTAPQPTTEVEALGGAYQIALEVVRDHGAGQHSFNRWEIEAQQRIRGLRHGQRLTLHGFLASTDGEPDVPFYMLYTLGGSGGLKAFRSDLLGTDGSRATLRGFRNYRFRDRDLLLLQAEYRVPIFNNIHATVFVDAGQVAPRRSELFRSLHTATGFSLGYVSGGKTVGRVDVGFSREGMQVFWSFGAFN